MKALKIILLLFISNCLTKTAFSQYYYYNDRYYNTDLLYEFGASAGIMNSITDIGGANTDNPDYFNEIRMVNNHISKSLYAGAIYRNFVGLRLEGTLGEVSSADSTITGRSYNLISKKIRNLSFRSKIAEIALTAEFHPLQLLNVEIIKGVSPYLISGIGWFHFNPQAQLKGKWIDLQPLHTEGQGFAEYPDRKPYKLSQFNIPMGFGVCYELSGLFNVRIEFIHRRLFTDYLDDASTKTYIDPKLFSKYLSPVQAAYAQALFNRSTDGSVPIFRGHSQNKDAYMSLSVKLGVVLGREKTGTSIGTRHLRCAF